MTPATGTKERALRRVGRASRNETPPEFAAPLSGRLQTRLQRSRPRAMRRHAARKAIRLVVLVTVDCVTALLAFSACRALGIRVLHALADSSASLVQRFPGVSFVSVSVVLSLLV